MYFVLTHAPKQTPTISTKRISDNEVRLSSSSITAHRPEEIIASQNTPGTVNELGIPSLP